MPKTVAYDNYLFGREARASKFQHVTELKRRFPTKQVQGTNC